LSLGIAETADRTSVEDNMSNYDLERFVRAQELDYTQALAELTAGRKESHWIWYVFPQLRELGHSPMAREYGIFGSDEAKAYLDHPVLGPRLKECVHAVLLHRNRPAQDILGNVDAMKFRSCLTLFSAVDPSHRLFLSALDAFFEGKPDASTLLLLGRKSDA
jgi:uncharacterized protein (DUF1810 family)